MACFQAYGFNANPYQSGPGSADIGKGVKNIEVNDNSGMNTSIVSSLEVQFDSPRDIITTNINISKYRDDTTGMTYHKVNVLSANSVVILEVKPPGSGSTYDVYFRKQFTPTLSEYLYKTNASRNGEKVSVVIPAEFVSQTGIYFIGIDPVEVTGGMLIL